MDTPSKQQEQNTSPSLAYLPSTGAIHMLHHLQYKKEYVSIPVSRILQELRQTFPSWQESAYAEWIETYSSQDFEVGFCSMLRCMAARGHIFRRSRTIQPVGAREMSSRALFTSLMI